MWGTGMPGAGKTIFASIVINEVESQARGSDSICIAYIYFRYSDHTTATVRDFLAVLVKQTIERHPRYLPFFVELYGRHIREVTHPSEAELLSLLRLFTELMGATFYFLDALDEAPPDVQLDLLEKLCTLNAKLFITSRPLAPLEACFPGAHRFAILAKDRDLNLHIAKEISRSPVLRSILNKEGPALREKITSVIKEKCGGMFLHASLQLDALRDCTCIYDVEKTLRDFPPRIEDVYQRTWERILDQTPNKTLLAKNVLVWVLCATRSLTIGEMRHVVAACPETSRFDRSRLVDEATLMSLCRGLVNVEEETKVVRFVHYTAKDVVKLLISESSPHPHSIPALFCMALLTQCGFQQATGSHGGSFETSLKTATLLAYAYEAWSLHARASLDDAFTAGQLASFIQGCRAFPIRFGIFNREFELLEPLHIAAYFDLPISFAGSSNLRNPNHPTGATRRTPLILAILRNSLSAARELLLLPRTLANATDRLGFTPLMWVFQLALVDQDYEPNVNQGMVSLLLAHPEINVNALNQSGRSALMTASILDAEEAVTLLLAHPKIQPNQVNSKGCTALMFASHHGSRRVVRVLVADPRVKVNQTANDGASALDMAKKEGRMDIVELLCAKLDRSHPHQDLLRRPLLPLAKKSQTRKPHMSVA
ncbi:ankyrin repeat-containing domain protein [Coprinopsis sp. MPI-PUGE-AT-0042]|nr:ankyrin repeat-containing domain protein [Coprinopsis sp. MPI-PUGE-AT-0042]